MHKAIRSCFYLLVVVLTISGCAEKVRPSIAERNNTGPLPDAESWNCTITVSDSGITSAVIRSDFLETHSNPTRTHLRGNVHAELFNREGSVTSVITSNEGIIHEDLNNLEAHGNVKVVSNDKTVLKTEKLYWDNQRKLIHTNAFVTITSPKERIQGHGMESDQYLRNYRIFRVTGSATAE